MTNADPPRRSLTVLTGATFLLASEVLAAADAPGPGPARSAVGETVRGAGRPDDDVAGAAFERLVADMDCNVALQDDEGLVVGVVMHAGALARPVVHEKERHRTRAVLAALERAGYVIARQVTGVHVVHGSRCLPVSGRTSQSWRDRSLLARVCGWVCAISRGPGRCRAAPRHGRRRGAWRT